MFQRYQKSKSGSHFYRRVTGRLHADIGKVRLELPMPLLRVIANIAYDMMPFEPLMTVSGQIYKGVALCLAIDLFSSLPVLPLLLNNYPF